MKKRTALALAIVLVLTLAACHMGSKEDVLFYYQRREYMSGRSASVIEAEERELSGYRDNLPYLITLYFHGPMDDSLRSPFPTGIAVVDIRREEDTLVLTLNAAFSGLKDMELSIASVCLAQTCFGLSDARQVRIESTSIATGETVSVTLTRDSYLLEDTLPTTPAAEAAGE